MAHYTVFGSASPSPMLTVYNDGAPAIETGGVFYLTDDNGPAVGWQCKGARVYIPNDPRVTGQPVVFRLRLGRDAYSAPLSDTFVSEKTTITPTAGGWCEVLWDDPVLIDYGPDNCFIVVSFAFTDPSAQAIYLYSNALPSTAIPSVDVGSLVYSESGAAHPRGNRAKYVIGANPPSDTSGWYGVDVIVDEAPAINTLLPVAAYGFNEGSGIVVNDETGNGHTLATSSPNFTASGHTASGLRQVAANTVAIDDTDGTFTTLAPGVAPYTVMFWGQYTAEGSAGVNWTVGQSVNDFPTLRSWAIAMSNGTNAVFHMRRGGFDSQITYPKQPLGEWHHYAMSYNQRGYLRAYVDGVIIGSAYAPGVGEVTAAALRIFGHNMQGQTIDDLCFFDTALAPDAVAYYMTSAIVPGERSGRIKHWNGTQWQAHPLKVWDGSTWITRKTKGYNGTGFIHGKG